MNLRRLMSPSEPSPAGIAHNSISNFSQGGHWLFSKLASYHDAPPSSYRRDRFRIFGEPNAPCRSLLHNPGFNVADDIADEFDFIGISIRDFHASEVVFEQYPQFKTIEPVGSEILS